MEADADRRTGRQGDPDPRRRGARVFYVATRAEAIYVLHAFEKKTRKTAARDLQIGRDRLRELEKLRQHHGKEERD
jgi:phage-related protein